MESQPDATPSQAPIWSRVCATLLDSVFLFITLVSIGGLTVGLIPYPDLNRIFNLGCIPVLSWLYFAILESSESQASYGKQLFGLRVMREDGGRLGFGQASLRYVGGVTTLATLCIGFLPVLFSARRQALHDWLSKSLVVRRA